jgi:DNA modification methylase
MKKDELLSLLKNLQEGRTCWRIKRDSAMEYVHPTQKPIALSAKAIKNSSQPGDVVLDLFGGSGSTMIACEQMHRKARMMELDPKYVHVEVLRWIKYTGKDVYRVRNGKKELYKIFEQEIDKLAVKD